MTIQPSGSIESLKKSQIANLPTKYGVFKLMAYSDEILSKDHLVLLYGSYNSVKSPLIRIHSECATGDIFGSLKCDCGPQLDVAMSTIVNEGSGLIIYLKQEGRDIGIVNKINAYALQDEGMDTVQANHHLGLDADLRSYEIAANILKDLGVVSVRLMTNNPAKVNVLTKNNIEVKGVHPIQIDPNEYNIDYLKVKKEKMQHQLHIIS